VFDHTLKALEQLRDPSPALAWSTLLHDCGKPATLKKTPERLRFDNHNRVGAHIAARALARLKASNALIDNVYACIDNHMNFINVRKMRLSTLKRFMAAPTFDDELEMHRADCVASHGDLENYHFLVRKKAEMGQESIKPAPFLSGKDLLELGFSPGPVFGTVLNEAYDRQLEEKFADRDQALEWLRGNQERFRLLAEKETRPKLRKEQP
jgi:putative nucleotidyltransferase with HDIG domain